MVHPNIIFSLPLPTGRSPLLSKIGLGSHGGGAPSEVQDPGDRQALLHSDTKA
jgi:hypothetical protein